MEMTLARVGNPEYARQNHSFGLTTLQNRHVRTTRAGVFFDFRAKHGIRHQSVVHDRKLARIIKNCRDVPGSGLFQYLDPNGNRHTIDSADVNAYLREISGRDVTAKDFQTCAATSIALLELSTLDEKRPITKATLQVVATVATRLGNTPAICRKCCIHPALFEAYLAGSLSVTVPIEGPDEFPTVCGSWSENFYDSSKDWRKPIRSRDRLSAAAVVLPL